MKCHAGIEPIREPGSEMLSQIMERGRFMGDPAGCVVCHGGDASVKDDKAKAHTGKPEVLGGKFIREPGSPWVNQLTCGQCHKEQVRVQWHSLMMTEAGKIQGVCWAFGGLTGYEHRFGNYAVENPKDPLQRLGTPAYRDYMARLTKLEPQVFVSRHEPLPEALKIDELHRLKNEPELAAFTYIREECQRCHHAVKGREKRGDFRGMGCSSCHIPYSNDGFYEGHDPTVPRDVAGRLLVHSIQGTSGAKVKVHEKTFSGIPVETCTTCHDRGKRIGVSFQGLMESPFAAPFNAAGKEQPALHTKHYIAMEQDIHYQKGMTCQDCHTSLDVHGDGFLAAANLAAVQIECADCHGTPDKFPWELPLGFQDEFAVGWDSVPTIPTNATLADLLRDRAADGKKTSKQKGRDGIATYEARGVARERLPHTEQGFAVEPRDGFLLTARGNPYENVVRDGTDIIVHTAAGKDIRMQPLKKLFQQKKVSERGQVAMRGVAGHLQKMECYTCHASWTPQCYGCHVKIDYTQKDKCPECQDSKSAFDWVAAGRRHADPLHALDRGEKGYDTIIPGVISEQRSYERWEEPILGINGEGRVSPLAPGCQPSVTIIGEDGKPILLNHIFRTPAGTEGGGENGQLAIDMSPTQPHTMTKNARSCESCHASRKAVGLGIDSTRPWNERHVVDLETVAGEILPQKTQAQMEPIANLDHDWSRIVDEDGKQVATVDHHFTLGRAFNKTELDRMTRDGTCLSCHKEIPTESLAVSLLHHVAKYSGQLPDTRDKHNTLMTKVLLSSAWLQVLLACIGIGGSTFLAALWYRHRRSQAKSSAVSDWKDGS